MSPFRMLAVALLLPCFALAQQNAMPLYPGAIPDAKPVPAYYIEKTDSLLSVTNVSIPTLIPFFPEKGTANGAAVIIFPGGAYQHLAMNKEGYKVAQEFNKIGVTAFVLKYRLPSDDIMIDKTIAPLQDAQQAVLTVRQHAIEWGINPAKIGIIGFSAGGHLASTEGTHFDRPVIDDKDHVSLRPDFMILLYPVISFGQYAHAGSRANLIGKNPTRDLLELYSNEKQVSSDTPPTLLIHAADDGSVPVQNSELFFDALRKAKVKTEMHIFEEGGHGFGLNNPKSKNKWFDWAMNWLDENGFLN